MENCAGQLQVVLSKVCSLRNRYGKEKHFPMGSLRISLEYLGRVRGGAQPELKRFGPLASGGGRG